MCVFVVVVFFMFVDFDFVFEFVLNVVFIVVNDI